MRKYSKIIFHKPNHTAFARYPTTSHNTTQESIEMLILKTKAESISQFPKFKCTFQLLDLFDP